MSTMYFFALSRLQQYYYLAAALHDKTEAHKSVLRIKDQISAEAVRKSCFFQGSSQAPATSDDAEPMLVERKKKSDSPVPKAGTGTGAAKKACVIAGTAVRTPSLFFCFQALAGTNAFRQRQQIFLSVSYSRHFRPEHDGCCEARIYRLHFGFIILIIILQ